jgi:hypothetical protein
MRLLLAMTMVFAAASLAHARLGESADELTARFGDPLHKYTVTIGGYSYGWTELDFKKQGFEITVLLTGIYPDDPTSGQASVGESYYIPGALLTEEQIQSLLTDNSDGHQWKENPPVGRARSWTRDDGAEAELSPYTGHLDFNSKFAVDKKAEWDAAQKKPQAPSTDGF